MKCTAGRLFGSDWSVLGAGGARFELRRKDADTDTCIQQTPIRALKRLLIP
jgi:hypothetical protein